MRVQEIRKKSDEDLKKIFMESQDNVRSLRFKIGRKEVKNHQLLRAAKKDIAKILTVFRERQTHGS